MNTINWVQKAQKIHNNKYSYGLVNYKNRESKVTIICPRHGEFKQFPRDHLRGCGCRQCHYDKMSETNSMGRDEFVSRARVAHGNQYDYSKVDYKNDKTKIVITCSKHGEFKQLPHNHLRGHGCYKCNIVPLSTQIFISRVKIIHNNKYDYSKTDYKNGRTKVIIVCPKHGEFKQRPNDHYISGCPRCALGIISDKLTKNKYDFIEDAKETHGDKYDYSKTDYKNSTISVIIVCPKHGEFKQLPHNHLRGAGCPECNLDNKRLGKSKFIIRAELIHDDRYDYGLIEEITSLKQKVTIKCRHHGTFMQMADDHLRGRGCPQCSTTISCGHQDVIDFITSLGISCDINDRKIIYPYEIDILIPDYKLGIEFNGIYWHSFSKKESTAERLKHYNKTDLCKDKIRLLQVFENEWSEKKEIIKSIIKSKLGMNETIYARKCSVVELTKEQYNLFMDHNHLQGAIATRYKYGLLHCGEIVCAIGVNRDHKYEHTIARFANKINYNTVGGASRLFKKFINAVNPNKVMTFADRRFSDGFLYKKLGFRLIKTTSPNYYYIKSGKLYRRQKFQKHKQKNRLAIFDKTLTESQNMFNNGYRRLWDAGHYCFLWETKKQP